VCEVQADRFQSVTLTAYYEFSEHYAILTEDVFSTKKEVSF